MERLLYKELTKGTGQAAFELRHFRSSFGVFANLDSKNGNADGSHNRFFHFVHLCLADGTGKRASDQ